MHIPSIKGVTLSLIKRLFSSTDKRYTPSHLYSNVDPTKACKTRLNLNDSTFTWSGEHRRVRERSSPFLSDIANSQSPQESLLHASSGIVVSNDSFNYSSSPVTDSSSNRHHSSLIVRTLALRFTKNQTRRGKLARYSVLMAVGNGRGALGISLTKNTNLSNAIQMAIRLAGRNMRRYPRWEERTLLHDDQVKFKATKLALRPGAPGTGRRCHYILKELCKCVGIADISAKVSGSKNPLNVAWAFLTALERQQTPEQVSNDTGMKVIDVLKVYQYGCKTLSETLLKERQSNSELKKLLSMKQ